jgi:hypothetical protein
MNGGDLTAAFSGLRLRRFFTNCRRFSSSFTLQPSALNFLPSAPYVSGERPD